VSTYSLITPSMRAAVESTTSVGPCTVERGAILRFARAIGDPNPLFNDEAASRETPYGGLIAPPTFLRSLTPAIPPLPDGDTVPRVLDGGSAWKYHSPVRPGDEITAVTRLESLTQRTGRLGPMLLAQYVTGYTDRQGELLAVQQNTIIRTR